MVHFQALLIAYFCVYVSVLCCCCCGCNDWLLQIVFFYINDSQRSQFVVQIYQFLFHLFKQPLKNEKKTIQKAPSHRVLIANLFRITAEEKKNRNDTICIKLIDTFYANGTINIVYNYKYDHGLFFQS